MKFYCISTSYVDISAIRSDKGSSATSYTMVLGSLVALVQKLTLCLWYVRVREVVLTSESPNAQIMVTEVQCGDANCVPIETIIIVLGKDSKKWAGKILKPLVDVTAADIAVLDMLPIINAWTSPVADFEPSVLPDPPAVAPWYQEIFDDFSRGLSKLPQTQKNDAVNELVKFTERMKSEALAGNIQVANPATVVPTTAVTMVSMKPRQPQSQIPKQDAIDISPAPIKSLPEPSRAAADVSRPILSTRGPVKHDVAAANMFPAESDHSQRSSTRPRGCPCCDPDNLENIVDKLIFMGTPP